MPDNRRTTNFGVMVEYENVNHIRTTNFGVMVEYTPVPIVRTTNFGVMVEYTLVQHTRTSDIGLMVEYSPVQHARTSVIGLAVEYKPWWHIRTSSIGLMVEYCDFMRILNAIDVWPNGDVYVTGRFSSIGGIPAKNIARWDGTAWYSLGEGLYGPACYEREGLAIKVHPSGDVYAGGKFHQAGFRNSYHIARWDGSTWHPIGAYDGLNGDVHTIEIKPDGSEIYVGGDFTDEFGNPGSGLTRVAKYMVATNTFEPIGDGFDDIVYILKLSPSYDLYAAGVFTHSSTRDVNYISVFDGGAWVPLGNNDMNDYAVAIKFDSKGTMIVGGHFNKIGTLEVRGLAYWNGSNWLRPDIVFPPEYSRFIPTPDPACMPDRTEVDSVVINALLLGEEDDLFAGGESLSYMPGGYQGPISSDYSGITRVVNTGSAETIPTIYIKGQGKLRYIENETSMIKVYFDLDILTDEEIFIDFKAGTIRSTVRGDLSYSILSGSDFNKFCLTPGENKLAVLITDGIGSLVQIYFTPTHWSVDKSKVGEAY